MKTHILGLFSNFMLTQVLPFQVSSAKLHLVAFLSVALMVNKFHLNELSEDEVRTVSTSY